MKKPHNNGYWAQRTARTIELTLESFGIIVRVAEINNFKDYVEFRLDVAVGTPLESITKLHKDIAMAVASYTGDVEMVVPIPGTSSVGIHVPDKDGHIRQTFVPPKIVEEIKVESQSVTKSWREFLSDMFYLIAYGFVKIAELFHKRP